MQVCERSREGAREGKSTVLQSQRREKPLPEICHNKEPPPGHKTRTPSNCQLIESSKNKLPGKNELEKNYKS